MKKILFMLAAMLPILFIISSCSKSASEQQFVEKSLMKIGDGYYSLQHPDLIALGAPISWKHGLLFLGNYDEREENPFGDYELENILKDEDNDSYQEHFNTYIVSMFQTNVLFSEFKMVSREDFGMTDIIDRVPTKFDDPNSEAAKYIIEGNEAEKKEHEYKEYDDHIIFIEYKDIPIVKYTYKLDNDKLALIYIVNHPDDGYKIIRFNIENF